MVGSEGEPDPRPSDPSDDEPTDEKRTRDEGHRHWFTNDLLAFILTIVSLAFIGLAAYGSLNLQTVPTEILYTWVAGWGISVAWAFGAGAVEAWRGGESDG